MTSLNIIANRKSEAQIEELIVECSTNQDFRFKNNITQYPTEEGFYVSDHIQQESNQFSISAVFTDTPFDNRLINRNDLDPLIAASEFSRSTLVLFKLLEYGGFKITRNIGQDPVKVADAIPLDIFTPVYNFPNMYVESITANRSRTNCGGLYVNITFKEVGIVKNTYTEIKNANEINGKAPGIKNKVQNKKQTGKTPKKKVKNKSVLRWIVDGVRGK